MELVPSFENKAWNGSKLLGVLINSLFLSWIGDSVYGDIVPEVILPYESFKDEGERWEIIIFMNLSSLSNVIIYFWIVSLV